MSKSQVSPTSPSASLDATSLRLVLESAADFVIIAADREGRVTLWTAGAENLFGYAAPDMLGRPVGIVFSPEDRANGVAELELRKARSDGRAEDERWHMRRDGSRFWGVSSTIRLDKPDAGFVKIIRDATAQKLASDRLAQAEWDLRTLVEGMPQLVWRSCDKGRWTWSSPQWLDFTGQTQTESHDHGWIAALHPDDRAVAADAWKQARPDGTLDVEFRVYRASDGAYVWHRTRSRPVRDDAGHIIEWLGTTTDVHDLKTLQQRQQALVEQVKAHVRELESEMEQRKRVEAQLLYTAYHDDLTKLRNRPYLMDRVRRAVARRDTAQEQRFAVLFIDLDRFKLINDSLGHQAGNLLLIEAADRMQGCMRPWDTLARLGGDEFAILVDGFDNFETVADLAHQIIKAMRRPVWLGAQEVFSSCSIGAVEATAPHRLPDELLRDADIAMFEAKRRHVGFVPFTDAMRDGAVAALTLRTELRHALARHEFVLHYQPICNPVTAELTGFEALLRWRNPQRGIVPPTTFIPIAEETGMIVDIGQWVLREACSQMRAWTEQRSGPRLAISVNVSGKELTSLRFVQGLRECLQVAGLLPEQLQIEVTESVLLPEPDLVGNIVNDVRALGVKVALDDFGTGYSSLSYLTRFKMDAIKIDRSFIAGMLTQPQTRAVVDTIVQLGRALDLEVIGEGVETEAQLRELAAAGCGSVQGYLLGRPAPPGRLDAWFNHIATSTSGEHLSERNASGRRRRPSPNAGRNNRI